MRLLHSEDLMYLRGIGLKEKRYGRDARRAGR